MKIALFWGDGNLLLFFPQVIGISNKHPVRFLFAFVRCSDIASSAVCLWTPSSKVSEMAVFFCDVTAAVVKFFWCSNGSKDTPVKSARWKEMGLAEVVKEAFVKNEPSIRVSINNLMPKRTPFKLVLDRQKLVLRWHRQHSILLFSAEPMSFWEKWILDTFNIRRTFATHIWFWRGYKLYVRT